MSGNKDTEGLIKKYQVFKDGVEVEDNLFVLNLTKDEAARRAALSYAGLIANKKLEKDLKTFYQQQNLSCSYWNILVNAFRSAMKKCHKLMETGKLTCQMKL